MKMFNFVNPGIHLFQEDQENQCPVCFDPMDDARVVLNCGHNFHDVVSSYSISKKRIRRYFIPAISLVL